MAVAERVLFLKDLTHKRRFYDVPRCRKNVLFLEQIGHSDRAALDLAVVNGQAIFPVNVRRIVSDHRCFDTVDAAQQIFKHRGGSLTVSNTFLKLFELSESDRCLKLADAIVQSHKVMVSICVPVAPRFIDIEEHVAGNLFVIGDDHAAFAGGHMLALLEAETADVTYRSRKSVTRFRKKCLCRVLDHGQIVLLRQRHDRLHIAWIAKQMCDDDRLGSFADFCLDRIGGDIQCFRVNFAKDGNHAAIHQRRQSTHIGDRGCDDLVARIRVDGRDRDVYRRRAGGACICKFRAKFFGKFLLKHFAEFTFCRRQRSALQSLGNVTDLCFAKRPPGRVLIRRQHHEPFGLCNWCHI